jgi:hypothetical protein
MPVRHIDGVVENVLSAVQRRIVPGVMKRNGPRRTDNQKTTGAFFCQLSQLMRTKSDTGLPGKAAILVLCADISYLKQGTCKATAVFIPLCHGLTFLLKRTDCPDPVNVKQVGQPPPAR